MENLLKCPIQPPNCEIPQKSGFVPEHIRNISRNISENFRKCSGQFPEKVRNKSVFFTFFPEKSRKVPETFWNISGTIPEQFPNTSGKLSDKSGKRTFPETIPKKTEQNSKKNN